MNNVSKNMPPLASLRAFEAIARNGSFTKAAVELSVTKSAISHQVKALEIYFGTALLKRGRSRLGAEPTEVGIRLLEGVQRSLGLLEETCRVVRCSTNARERKDLRISVGASFSALWLCRRISKFLNEFTEVDISILLHTSQTPAWKAKNIDLAFLHVRDGGPHWPEAEDIPLIDEYIFPICSPDLIIPARRDDLDIFSEYRLISEQHVSSPESCWSNWESSLALKKNMLRAPLNLSGMSAVVAAAESCAGIALARSPMVVDGLINSRLIALFPHLKVLSPWNYVIRPCPGKKVSDAARDFIEFCRSEAELTSKFVISLNN